MKFFDLQHPFYKPLWIRVGHHRALPWLGGRGVRRWARRSGGCCSGRSASTASTSSSSPSIRASPKERTSREGRAVLRHRWLRPRRLRGADGADHRRLGPPLRGGGDEAGAGLRRARAGGGVGRSRQSGGRCWRNGAGCWGRGRVCSSCGGPTAIPRPSTGRRRSTTRSSRGRRPRAAGRATTSPRRGRTTGSGTRSRSSARRTRRSSRSTSATPPSRRVCEAWLGPAYQMTAQVNLVRPGGAAQTAHRDYHLGFQTAEGAARFPAHVHELSPYLTLQGAVAHVDMAVESGPTKLLPFSQLFRAGYMAYHREDFRALFEARHIQMPLAKGDAVFFNPALFHAGGENRTGGRAAHGEPVAGVIRHGAGDGVRRPRGHVPAALPRDPRASRGRDGSTTPRPRPPSRRRRRGMRFRRTSTPTRPWAGSRPKARRRCSAGRWRRACRRTRSGVSSTRRRGGGWPEEVGR